jgi:hypothetical protein
LKKRTLRGFDRVMAVLKSEKVVDGAHRRAIRLTTGNQSDLTRAQLLTAKLLFDTICTIISRCPRSGPELLSNGA